MKFAVISDIHGNIDALEAVLADIARRSVEKIVNLGDCLSGPFDPVATANRLIQLSLPTVRGNHDRQLYDRPREKMGLWESWAIDDLSFAHLDWIRSLPLVLNLDDVLMCHATPERDDENWLDCRGHFNRLISRELDEVELRASGVAQNLILCGHTHTPRNIRLPDGRRIVNPGAVGCPAYLDTRSEPAFVHQTGSPDARYAIVDSTGLDWLVDLISVPYDPSRMARLARDKGAESWARAVETGWIN
jgi:putative phosphoesterase